MTARCLIDGKHDGKYRLTETIAWMLTVVDVVDKRPFEGKHSKGDRVFISPGWCQDTVDRFLNLRLEEWSLALGPTRPWDAILLSSCVFVLLYLFQRAWSVGCKYELPSEACWTTSHLCVILK